MAADLALALLTSSPARVPCTDLPGTVTAVERTTRVRDCLSLMLGNRMLYAPVTADSRPIDVVSMRDINLFLAPDTA